MLLNEHINRTDHDDETYRMPDFVESYSVFSNDLYEVFNITHYQDRTAMPHLPQWEAIAMREVVDLL